MEEEGKGALVAKGVRVDLNGRKMEFRAGKEVILSAGKEGCCTVTTTVGATLTRLNN